MFILVSYLYNKYNIIINIIIFLCAKYFFNLDWCSILHTNYTLFLIFTNFNHNYLFVGDILDN